MLGLPFRPRPQPRWLPRRPRRCPAAARYSSRRWPSPSSRLQSSLPERRRSPALRPSRARSPFSPGSSACRRGWVVGRRRGRDRDALRGNQLVVSLTVVAIGTSLPGRRLRGRGAAWPGRSRSAMRSAPIASPTSASVLGLPGAAGRQRPVPAAALALDLPVMIAVALALLAIATAADVDRPDRGWCLRGPCRLHPVRRRRHRPAPHWLDGVLGFVLR